MVSSRKYLLSKMWADDIKERDNKKCVICGSKNNLEVHHIYGVMDYGFLCSDTSNGITLCHECHIKYHQLYDEDINPYTWTLFVLNNQWNATNISVKYNNGQTQEFPLYRPMNPIIEHKDLINGNLRNTVIHAVQTSGFDYGVTPIEWVKLYINQVYGVMVKDIDTEINYLIKKGLFEKIGKHNVRFNV